MPGNQGMLPRREDLKRHYLLRKRCLLKIELLTAGRTSFLEQELEGQEGGGSGLVCARLATQMPNWKS